MNLSFLFIFIIIATIIIDFLTYKKDEEIDIKKKKINRVIKNFISICLTYIVFTLIFSLVFRYLLVPEDYIFCDNTCTITITNTLVGVIALIFQILNIYNFYDNYIYTYRYLSSHIKITEKVLIFLIGLATILLNEFMLSNINLEVLVFSQSIFNILIKIVIYSAYIFMPLLIIIREIYRILSNREKDEFE